MCSAFILFIGNPPTTQREYRFPNGRFCVPAVFSMEDTEMLSIPVTFLNKRSRLIAKAQYVADICLQGLYVSIENEYEASEDVRNIDVRFDRIEQLNRKVEQFE